MQVFKGAGHAQTQTQSGVLKGTVKDQEGHPLQFVTVSLLNTTYAVMTDENGNYTFNDLAPGKYTLFLTSIGFNKTTKAIELRPSEVLILSFNLSKITTDLPEIEVIAKRSSSGIGHLDDVSNNIIFAGKKNEVILLDSLNANTAQNNPRQVLGRIPGINFSETEGNGFPSNGIGFRGLNPSQSVETNTRQNGYNIAADIYGYPEAYYVPPLEAVERIEVVRGASSLQFGPQFGGLVNYVVKKGSAEKPFSISSQQTGGSYGLFNSFNSLGGAYKKWNYYSFGNYRRTDGWRPNSGYSTFSGFAGLHYQATEKLSLGLEYSILRNRIQMPGGLDDAQFNQDAHQSFRARNWLNSPWNILTAVLEYKINANHNLSVKSTVLFSERNLVWRNEDGGPGSADSIDPATLHYVKREVQREAFTNSTTEARLLSAYTLFGSKNTLASGLRFYSGSMSRKGGGPGSQGSGFDLDLYGGDYGYSLNYTTTNVAVFVENIFRLNARFSVTPGFRYEFIRSTVKGYVNDEAARFILHPDAVKNRNIPLAGIGLQYKTTETSSFYGNISQAYRPIDYSAITPVGVAAKIDPNLQDAQGFNADLGWRGTVKNYLNVDVGAFYLGYNNRVGTTVQQGPGGDTITFVTNIANSVHKGIESYLEFDPVKMLLKHNRYGTLSFFNSFSFIDARYTTGNYTGKHVEFAPLTINRFGSTYSYKNYSMTFLVSNTAQSFSDATNELHNTNAIIGLIPAYQVMDFSARLKIKAHYNLKAGINNLADKKYFTQRTAEYPGPGIIPALGRSFYISVGLKF
jgi:Fe(3+) dicitrate transport protein